ncbi:MAG: nicotinamide riboside transporter PnuC [Pseudomonas sp.]|uniref:nicotinamide riboside transporter PnuC n=1 Tax=Pseudomonas sp. TaxID=306 RepID=UPI003393E0DB
MSPLELFAAVLGVIAVWLTLKQNPWGWPIGLVMVVIYGWIFFDAKLYSDMLLQGVFAVLQLYGWWQWTRGGQQHHGRQVSHLQASGLLLSLALGAAGSLGLGYLMATYTDAAAPWLDATLAAFSLVAQVWMAQKRLECWPLWAVLDLLYVGLYVHRDLIPTAVLYALFTLLALKGWQHWRRDPAVAAA